MQVEGHPLLPPPDLAAVEEEARRSRLPAEAALESLLRKRAKIIRMEEDDPFRYGWESPIWKLADAILGLDCHDETFLKQLDTRLGMDWETWRQQMLELLGLSKQVLMLLILGANRSSKSEYAAKRCQQMGTYNPGASIAAFQMSEPRSVKDQQPLFWKYMLPEWRIQVAGAETYIKYKRKTGFSEMGFINPVGSDYRFLNYKQDRGTAIEGPEYDLMWPDELVPPDWLETMKYRLASRQGKAIATFTPVNGYTPSVGLFCDGATVARTSTAFMLPRDGGEPDVAATLGLERWELEELVTAEIEKRPARVPYSRPEDILAWLENKPSQPVRQGRVFHEVPRVLRCADPRMAVIFFHSCDGPYGNPRVVIDLAKAKGATDIRIRVYGVAERQVSTVFPKFSRKIHVIDQAAIPEDGTNYFFVDPAGDRNWFMTWLRVTPHGAYVYREWPGSYDIPGVGVPGPWAVPSAKKEGLNDGARGEGQQSFGFGLWRYKFEIARLEHWADYLAWFDGVKQDPDAYPLDEELESWDERNGAEEVIEGRVVDSRAASTPRIERDRPVTLLEDLIDARLDCQCAPGAEIRDGLNGIISALDYNESEDGSFTNRPKLMIATQCPNTIYALGNYRNVDGEHGACKDPVDNLRYFFTSICDYVEPGPRGRRGFYYTRGAGDAPVRSRAGRARPGCLDRTGGRRAIFRGR